MAGQGTDDNKIRCMRVARWIDKATHTLAVFNTYGFSTTVNPPKYYITRTSHLLLCNAMCVALALLDEFKLTFSFTCVFRIVSSWLVVYSTRMLCENQ
jgi:hypothetical protein